MKFARLSHKTLLSSDGASSKCLSKQTKLSENVTGWQGEWEWGSGRRERERGREKEMYATGGEECMWEGGRGGGGGGGVSEKIQDQNISGKMHCH